MQQKFLQHIKKKTTNQLNLLITHSITKVQKMCCTIQENERRISPTTKCKIVYKRALLKEPNKEISKAIRKDVIQTIEEYESTETQSSNQ